MSCLVRTNFIVKKKDTGNGGAHKYYQCSCKFSFSFLFQRPQVLLELITESNKFIERLQLGFGTELRILVPTFFS